MPVFSSALDSMDGEREYWRNPEPFQEYVSRNGISVKGTARYISVQSFSDLAPELRENKVMVFRLGSTPGLKHTNFALARVVVGWDDYFMFDEELFGNSGIEKMSTDWRSDAIFPFSAVPKLTETSHVNLALAGGVFEKALNLDASSVLVPATGRGRYSFRVRPNARLNASWSHKAGQVEIDSLFVARRLDKKILFVVEAKSGDYPGSLPKHKLVYPVLSVAERVPEEFDIVPVYIRIQESDTFFRFNVAECSFPDPRKGVAHINELKPKASRVVEIEK